MGLTRLTKRHTTILLKKIQKSPTKLTIFDFLQNATMSSVYRIGHWTMLGFFNVSFLPFFVRKFAFFYNSKRVCHCVKCVISIIKLKELLTKIVLKSTIFYSIIEY